MRRNKTASKLLSGSQSHKQHNLANQNVKNNIPGEKDNKKQTKNTHKQNKQANDKAQTNKTTTTTRMHKLGAPSVENPELTHISINITYLRTAPSV